MLDGIGQGNLNQKLDANNVVGVEGGIASVRVLLVKDNAPAQMALKKMITSAGYSCDVAGNGSEALKAMETIVYQIVLMDVQMPVKDGAETTRELRAMEAITGERIPVIGISASVSNNERCLEAGMDDFLQKPVQKDALLPMIARWANKKLGVVAADATDVTGMCYCTPFFTLYILYLQLLLILFVVVKDPISETPDKQKQCSVCINSVF
jgi:CheY-like chemotaxis protein